MHDAAAHRELARRRGLVEWLDRLADAGSHRLRHLTSEVIVKDREWVLYLEKLGYLFDAEKPLIEEGLHEMLGPRK